MLIHEYQAKELMKKAGILVPQGKVAQTPEEAQIIASELNSTVAIKAQVHAGGRGKAGGIKLAKDSNQARQKAKEVLQMKIKNLPVEKVLVEQALEIEQEFYLGITLDRSKSLNCIIFSPSGGIDIEVVARKTPEKIFKIYIDPLLGLQSYQIRQLIYSVKLKNSLQKQLFKITKSLEKVYTQNEATLTEINPLVLTKGGDFIAADAKIILDDNALFRHPELLVYREIAESDPIERRAHQQNIAYVRLGGDIGIIGNGAGLVMTTLDVVSLSGGKPANFLDIGGGAKADVVKKALEIVLSDSNVKGILFNIFGGITRCDEVAKGIIQAASGLEIKMPVVVRLCGTRSKEGEEILSQANFTPAETMREAAEKIVELVVNTVKRES